MPRVVFFALLEALDFFTFLAVAFLALVPAAAGGASLDVTSATAGAFGVVLTGMVAVVVVEDWEAFASEEIAPITSTLDSASAPATDRPIDNFFI